MPTKLAQLRRYLANGDYHAALRLAASWGRLGSHKAAITRGWAARTHPDFYRQIGQDPDELVRLGIEAICDRYGIHHQHEENEEMAQAKTKDVTTLWQDYADAKMKADAWRKEADRAAKAATKAEEKATEAEAVANAALAEAQAALK